jgi:hypothetical protein
MLESPIVDADDLMTWSLGSRSGDQGGGGTHGFLVIWIISVNPRLRDAEEVKGGAPLHSGRGSCFVTAPAKRVAASAC